jgi:hypothetical protein
MKFVALFILLGAMAWSWNGYKRDSHVSVSTHYQLQNELKSIIAQVISENVQNPTNLVFKKFWTEPTQTEAVRAVFEYSFDSSVEKSDQVTTSLKGVAILKPNAEGTTWTLEKIEVDEESAEYENGLLVQPTPKK